LTVGDIFRKVRDNVKEKYKEEELKFSEEDAMKMISGFNLPEPESQGQLLTKKFTMAIKEKVKE